MSVSMLTFVLCCLGAYKLGAFNERHPGRSLHLVRANAGRFWNWINGPNQDK